MAFTDDNRGRFMGLVMKARNALNRVLERDQEPVETSKGDIQTELKEALAGVREAESWSRE